MFDDLLKRLRANALECEDPGCDAEAADAIESLLSKLDAERTKREEFSAKNAEVLNSARRDLFDAREQRDKLMSASLKLEGERDAALSRLSALLNHPFAEECQECAIGKSDAWKAAKGEVVESQSPKQWKPEVLDQFIEMTKGAAELEERFRADSSVPRKQSE